MLYISKWKATAILLTALICCLLAVPNFFPESTVKRWPAWAQRHIVLGLDLQGGSHILLEVDSNAVRKEKIESLRDDVRRVVRENRLGSPAAATIRGGSVEFRVREGVDPALALSKFRELAQPLGGILSATGQRSLTPTGQTREPSDERFDPYSRVIGEAERLLAQAPKTA